ncbi:MAG: hypothetical protein M3083_18050 [Actinomycetota bacterium]|nr:hypothetical protein [Actinomycetota bacterium]MDQ6947211.1 hypothetical protein [Actinomycetota bacterium]
MTHDNPDDRGAENRTSRQALRPAAPAAPRLDGDPLTVALPAAGWRAVVAVLDWSARDNAARGLGARHADLADDIARQAGLTQRPSQERQP